jgi:Tfp pilus assembly protein FimT
MEAPMRAHSLLEMAIVLSLATTLCMLASPGLASLLHQGRDQLFASRITACLMMARRMGQLAPNGVQLNFAEEGNLRIQLAEEEEAALSLPYSQDGWSNSPLPGLPHPSQSGTIDVGLSSNHGNTVRFQHQGSSSATITFSRADNHAVCAVVSSQTGRFRVYLWDDMTQQWLAHF